MQNDIRTKGEFQLTDALERMIQGGCKFRTAPVQKWLDCGLVETLLSTNAHILQRNAEGVPQFEGSEIIGPCHIGKNVVIKNSKVGPNVSVGDNCVIENAEITNAILWDGVKVAGQKVADTVIHE